MPTELLAVVSDISSVDETARDLYTQKGDKYVLNVKPVDGFELDDVKGLKTALGAERNLKAQLEAQVKVFEGIDPNTARQAISALSAFGDITPDKAKEAIEAAKKLQELDPKKDAERIAAEKIDQHTKAITAQFSLQETEYKSKIARAEETVNGLTTQLVSLTRDNLITTELTKVDPLDDARDALVILAGQFVKSELVDNQIVTKVVDANGNPRIKDVAGTPFTVADLMAELRESRPALFKAENKQGLGTSPGAATGGSGGTKDNPWKAESFNFTKQMQILRENPELAARLKKEAGK